MYNVDISLVISIHIFFFCEIIVTGDFHSVVGLNPCPGIGVVHLIVDCPWEK